METTQPVVRERLNSRLGFLLLAAGCAVGLGNVWRFPFIVGQNGGGAFVLVYLFFLVLLGFPLLTAELAVGRASAHGISGAMRTLAPASKRRFWETLGIVIFAGNLLLMMYYTTVSGWLVGYTVDYVTSGSPILPGETSASAFERLMTSPCKSVLFLLVSVTAAMGVCLFGVQKGVERVVKWMMLALLTLLVVLAVRSVTLPGAAKGVSFYLAPDWSRFMTHPFRAVFDAMGQAFFTLSVGVGCMTIFGSYCDRGHTLVTESVWIIVIDTFVAFLSGLIIFPVCFSFGVDVCSGPGLIFIALPQVFAALPGGAFWGALFFLFLAIAALTTIIAVFECLIGGLMDECRCSRCASALTVGGAVAVLSLPCVLGFSVLSDFHPFGGTMTVLDCEDFVFSQFWLPLGALSTCFFCLWPYGWGWLGFRREANEGKGLHLPLILKPYLRYVLPLILLIVLIGGLLVK